MRLEGWGGLRASWFETRSKRSAPHHETKSLRPNHPPPCGGGIGRALRAIDALERPLGVRDRALHVIAAGAVVGEHVDDDEVGDRARRLLADRAEAARGA